MNKSFKYIILETGLSNKEYILFKMIESLEDAYSKNSKELKTSYDTIRQNFIEKHGATSEEYDEVVMSCDEYHSDLFEELISFRYGLLMTIYIYLESSLMEICSLVGSVNSITLQPKDVSGKGITRYKKYLTKVVGLNLSDQNILWEKLTNLNLVRNVIAHSNGKLPEEISHIHQVVSKEGGLKDIYGSIHITKDYLESCIKNISSYLREILKKL